MLGIVRPQWCYHFGLEIFWDQMAMVFILFKFVKNKKTIASKGKKKKHKNIKTY
jgi:hypothetical protein